ncbi:hypothetical protein Sjap_024623 [Stephania japonica]|uniref:DYW domain-containing protein n=1 Tax=Stephania japonica TaxID=461633 RepID=A0AAP0EDQ5_9MAGN
MIIHSYVQSLPFKFISPFNGNKGHCNQCSFSIPQKKKLRSLSVNVSSNCPTVNVLNDPIVPSKRLPSYYSKIIQECIDSGSFELGKRVHAQMLGEGIKPETFLGTKIVMLYARSGVLEDLYVARKLFDEMHERNSTTWNTMILGYAKMGEHLQVVDLFFRMRESGIFPDKFTFPSVVKACAALEDFDGVRQVHGLVFKTCLSGNLVVGCSLVDGYARCGSIDDAVAIFENIDEMNVISCNAIVGGYVKVGRWEEAWSFFLKMQELGLPPDHFTFATAARICSSLRSLEGGKQVHAKLIISDFASDVFVCNSLIDMYAKCGDSESSLQVFELMTERDQVTWNSMISAQVQSGHFLEALMLFQKMHTFGYKSDRYNLASALVACTGLAYVEMGEEVHGSMVRNFLDYEIITGSALVDMYSKCGHVDKARQAFEKLVERNEVSWNALIAGYVEEGEVQEAFKLYREMELAKNVEPDPFTFTSLLTLCADQRNKDLGKQIHAHLIRIFGATNIILETELVHMYAKCGCLNDAQSVFDQMVERNSYSWNSLIEGYEQNNQAERAIELFKCMQLEGTEPDCFSLASALSACINLSDARKGKGIHGFILRNALENQGVLRYLLVHMYAKNGNMNYACKAYNCISDMDVTIQNIMVSAFVGCDRIDEAWELFNKMEERNIVSWNAILMGFAKNGLKADIFAFFQRMQEENVEFDSSTLVTLLDFCASLPSLAQGEQLHTLAIKKFTVQDSVVLGTALVDTYAKAGAIEKARKTFDEMNDRNTIAWNAMITGYSKHGHSEEVLLLFEQMHNEGIYPNDVTFLSVLSACGHTGKVEEGLKIFISMLEDHKITAKVEHYTCMVDLLGRAGYLEDAKEVIARMPLRAEASTWGALLGACRIHHNAELGQVAADQLFALDPQNPGHYVALSNIYAVAGKWDMVEEIRNMMRIRGVTKDPGVSWIDIGNETHKFYAGCQSHPNNKEIYVMLRHLTLRMKELGYVPDTKFVLSNAKDLEDEEYFIQHSERLAIALGLISLPKKSTIRVFKNLRICGDCHTAAKFISKIMHRRIIVRDNNRFHHFENGVCSCGDYW